MTTKTAWARENGAGPGVQTVLIVDDQPEMLAALRRLLRDEPFRVVALGSPAEALAWLESNRADLVLADERMPGMRGTDLLGEVRRRWPDAVRVILTGYPGSATVTLGLEQGVDWLISKPWNDEALKLTLRQLLEDRDAPPAPPPPAAVRDAGILFRLLVEGVEDYAIMMLSPEGHVVSWNIGAQRSTGFRAEEILGHHVSTFYVRDEAVAGKPERLLRAAEQGGRVEDEGWRLRKDGSRFWSHVVITAIRDPGGRLLGFGKITRDLTETRRAEEEKARLSAQMLQGQKLQAIGQLSAGIAHEINNPVGYILSNLNTMGEYCQDLRRLLRPAAAAAEAMGRGEDPGPALTEFRRISTDIRSDQVVADLVDVVSDCKLGGEKIRDIVRSLREFSHVDEGELRPTDLNKCLEDSLRICWNELKYKGEVTKDFAKELPLLPCYPQRLGQVFINLLVNAGQAIAKRGEIRLSTRLEGEDLVIRIRDSGTGIAPENLGKIFDPFFTTKDVGAGTGLGLHVAYKIVTAHQGRIEVQSEPGHGTEFTVRLPVGGPRAASVEQ